MSDPVYCYPPDHVVLRNRLGIRRAAALDRAERRLVTQRMREGVPQGDFDLAHLRAIHKHLFQDVYEWAGELRTVEISKSGHQFQLRRYIERGMADIHSRIVATEYFRNKKLADFAQAAGRIIGDVNDVHPFREGNGRAQAQYLKQLAERAGPGLDLTRLEPATWVASSVQAHEGAYESMVRAIRAALVDQER